VVKRNAGPAQSKPFGLRLGYKVFNALHDWQQTVPSLPGSFAREITFGHFDPAYRVTLEVTIDAFMRLVDKTVAAVAAE